jgi:Phosphomannose isomerase type I
MFLSVMLHGQVLSIETALSIQSHPDKQLAKELHELQPQVVWQDPGIHAAAAAEMTEPHLQIYKDPNHKPEMAIALSDNFEALCGFVTMVELQQVLQESPELWPCIGYNVVQALLKNTKGTIQVNPGSWWSIGILSFAYSYTVMWICCFLATNLEIGAAAPEDCLPCSHDMRGQGHNAGGAEAHHSPQQQVKAFS